MRSPVIQAKTGQDKYVPMGADATESVGRELVPAVDGGLGRETPAATESVDGGLEAADVEGGAIKSYPDNASCFPTVAVATTRGS